MLDLCDDSSLLGCDTRHLIHSPRFRSVVVPSSSGFGRPVTSWHWTWRHYEPSKRLEPFTQRQIVTCQKIEPSSTPLWEPQIAQRAICLTQLADGIKYFCTFVSFDMVRFSPQLFEMSDLFCGTVMCWLYSPGELPSNPVLSSASRTSTKIFRGLHSSCTIQFLCFNAQNLLRVTHAYLMKHCVVLSDRQ